MNGDDNLNVYVYEKLINIQEKNLEIIIKSIDNQRTKAGLLMGFFFIVTISSLEELSDLYLCY